MGNNEYAPPDTKALSEARDLRLKEIKMEAVIKEMVIYFFFLFIIFFISYQQRDPRSYQFGQNVRNTFLSGFENVSIMIFQRISFRDLKNVSMYMYYDTTVFPSEDRHRSVEKISIIIFQASFFRTVSVQNIMTRQRLGKGQISRIPHSRVTRIHVLKTIDR